MDTGRGQVSSSVGASAFFPTPAASRTTRPGSSVQRRETVVSPLTSESHMSEPAGSGPFAGFSAGASSVSSPSSVAGPVPGATLSVSQEDRPVTES